MPPTHPPQQSAPPTQHDDEVLDLARTLIARPSVTPRDEGCLELLAQRLEKSGFHCRRLDAGEVSNLWAVHGDGAPLLTLAGHTDVVPAGSAEQWHSPPFEGVVRDGFLHGRGAADMKGPLAAMVVACERFLRRNMHHTGRLALLLTSDEEGVAVDGTAHVMRWLKQQGERIDWCVIGEPSGEERLGDCIRHGRRGSLSGQLRIFGKQGHSAYPHKADNPIHKALPALRALAEEHWDDGDAHFPPTHLQLVALHAGVGAYNVIPATLEVHFNFRFSPRCTVADLERRCRAILEAHQLRYQWQALPPSLPFLTPPGTLTETVCRVVRQITGRQPTLSTAGGTSDGRFIAPSGAQVVELGPCNATIHKVNERVRISDLEDMARVYEALLAELLAAPKDAAAVARS